LSNPNKPILGMATTPNPICLRPHLRLGSVALPNWRPQLPRSPTWLQNLTE